MKWYELAENPRAITELYTEVPLLQSVRLVEVHLLQDGPQIMIKMDLPRFPDKAPARWKQQGHTHIQLQLDFWDLRSLEIVQWSDEDRVEIQIGATAEGRINLAIVSSLYHIQAIAQGFRIKVQKSRVSL